MAAELDLANLYARHRQGLFTHALSITGCPAAAEDAIHDAFARLCRQPRRADRDPAAYVFAAVRSAAIDQLRRRHRPAADVASIFVLDACGDPDARAIEAERGQSVKAALARLQPDQREVVVLRIYAGLSFAQIADVIGEPLPTVASRHRRSLERLREYLEKLV